MPKRLTLLLALAALFLTVHGQEILLPQKENPFTFEAAYLADAYGNARGGIKTGAGYMGMANMGLGFDTQKAGWWKGGSIFINGASIHGKSLSESYLGDLQVASNIDAGTHVYLHEFWLKQTLGSFSFTLGLQDLNINFMMSEAAGEFINSSFGMPPVISVNLPLPIFPLTGLGISARWNISEQFAWQTAVFDGCQKPFEHNPHNLHWSFSKNDGMLLATEFHAKFKIKQKEGTYKIGAYYHSGLTEFDEATQSANTVFTNNYGVYLIADQTIFERQNRKINLFAQIAAAPKSKNQHAYYLGLGANYHGVFSKKEKDILGLAIANLDRQRRRHRQETTLELFYKWQFNGNFALQSDVQYIVNPAGASEQLPDALVGILRLHVKF
ncbi:MAG: carbohydrate porin [Prevotellaceae bacterium]|jgi:porin|nr:carbohydrate porin [Prevotellaceae bacterium]